MPLFSQQHLYLTTQHRSVVVSLPQSCRATGAMPHSALTHAHIPLHRAVVTRDAQFREIR